METENAGGGADHKPQEKAGEKKMGSGLCGSNHQQAFERGHLLLEGSRFPILAILI
jgi:hypothetical protein